MANTLKFGNGNWATKDGSTLAYNDESGFNPLPFDFTRASSATVVNKNGLIETVASGIPRIDFLGNTKGALLLEPSRTNLIAQSEAFDNAYWTKGGASIQGDPSTAGVDLLSGWDFTSGWITFGGGTSITNSTSFVSESGQGVFTGLGIDTSKTYRIRITGIQPSGGYISLKGGTTGVGFKNITDLSFSEDFYINATTLTSASNDLYIRLSGHSSGTTITVNNFQIEEVQGFASPSADSPLGAFKLVEDTSTSDHFLFNNIAPADGLSNTFSVLVKPAGRTSIQIYNGDLDQQSSFFNLTTKTIVNGSSVVSSNIKELTDGWFKCSLTTTNAKKKIYIKLNNGTTSSYTGDGTSGVYIYGAQLEAGSYSTSLINTSGSAVTRQADVCTNGANSEVINSTEGVLYAEIAALADDNSDRKISLSDGSLNNVINIGLSRFSGNINAEVKSGGVLQTAGFGATGVTQTNSNKFALSWGGGTTKFYVNGILASSHTSVTSPIGMNVLDFTLSSGFEKMYANVKDIRVYNTALTDAELIALTTI